jgi:predicted metalloprotease
MENQGSSRNVEDLRGLSGGGFRRGGIGIGSLVLALILGWVFGINPLQILGLMGGSGLDSSVPYTAEPAPPPPAGDAQAQFVSQILRSTEQVWGRVFAENGRSYQEPRLRLFRGSYPTACGLGQAAAGPFYCPDDQAIYLDLHFFDMMTQRLGAPGQFAHAYVVAHEVGHHVQNQLGILDRQQSPEAQQGATGTSVRIELQADCFAGVWANRAQQEHGWRLEPGDIETGLNAAAQIGDDTLQSRSQGMVVPDTFTHGTSAQRVRWFQRGFEGGQIESCDTFTPRTL